MYICNDCGATFEEPARESECMGEFWGAPAIQHYSVCPSCGDFDFDEAEMCEICGEWFAENVLTNGLCEDCYEETFD